MKIKVYKKKAKSKKSPLRLKLVQSDYDVAVIAVDDNGERITDGSIVLITSDGSLYLPIGVNKNLGLELDDNGSIRVGVYV